MQFFPKWYIIKHFTVAVGHNFLDEISYEFRYKTFFFHFFYLHRNLQHMWSLNKLVYYIVDLFFRMLKKKYKSYYMKSMYKTQIQRVSWYA